jgi:hypothetical protein
MRYKDWLKVKGSGSTSALAEKWKNSSHGQYWTKRNAAAKAAAAAPAADPKPPPVQLAAIPDYGDALGQQEVANLQHARDTKVRQATQSYSDWLTENVGAGAFNIDKNTGKMSIKNNLDTGAVESGVKGTRLKEGLTKQQASINSNAAARGMGRSGNRFQNQTQATNDYTKNINELKSAYRNASNAFSSAKQEADSQLETGRRDAMAVARQRETQRRHNTYGVGGWR